MTGLIAVVNENQQKEILDMLSDFEVGDIDGDYKFPLFIDFPGKTIRRFTSITICAILAQTGSIVRDYDLAKSIVESYLQERSQDNGLHL